MSIEFGVWRIDQGLKSVPWSQFDDEGRLESLIEAEPDLLGLDVLIIGRQVQTAFGKRIDLVAMDSEGDLYGIELKRDRTPRDVVAQALDYGSWIGELTHEDLLALWEEYHSEGRSLEEAFVDRFGGSPPDELNQAHHLVIVASELDASTERIVRYLSDPYGVPINVLFFRYFRDDGREYIARSWFAEPTERPAPVTRTREPWNGQDFYVSFGEDQRRSWDDARAYGFVSAGGGKWYSRSLRALSLGKRVFVHIPGRGYVGVGTVTEPARPARDVMVSVDGTAQPLLGVVSTSGMKDGIGDPERAEYVVRVDWIKTRNREDAVWQEGMFANQNSACKLRNRFTIERLTEAFGLDE